MAMGLNPPSAAGDKGFPGRAQGSGQGPGGQGAGAEPADEGGACAGIPGHLQAPQPRHRYISCISVCHALRPALLFHCISI